MPIDDRFGFFLLGCLVGYVLSYIVRSLREIKEELDEVDDMVRDQEGRGRRDRKQKRNEGGFTKDVMIYRVALGLVVFLTAAAAFYSQQANNKVDEKQNELEAVQAQLAHQTMCNRTVLRSALIALNERTTYSEAQVNANVDLQTSFSVLFGALLHKPPLNEIEQAKATAKYYQDLTNFVSIADKTKQKVEQNPFPKDEALDACLNDGD